MLPTIQIQTEKCTRCGLCLKDCLAKLLTFGEDGFPTFIPGGEQRCFRCQHCLAVCPQGALSWSGKNPANSRAIGTIADADALGNLLCQRRSIRAYRQENVAREKLAKLRQVMDFVPTGCNDHRLFFACAEDRSVTDTFREVARKSVLERIATQTLPTSIAHFVHLKPALEAGADIFFRTAPHFVAIAVPPESKDAHIDPYIAATQFEILANALELGTCWGGMATDLFLAEESLLKQLAIPDTHELKIILLFGTPAVRYARLPQPEPCSWTTLSGSF